MTITLRPITRDNLRECVALSPAEEQKGFVAPNVGSIAQAYVEPAFVPRAIYAGDTLVGFVMYGRDHDTGFDWIIRLMIDARFQRQGYARAATEAVIALLKAQPDACEIWLSYVQENEAAARLYASLGFQPTGEIDDGQVIARLPIAPEPAG